MLIVIDGLFGFFLWGLVGFVRVGFFFCLPPPFIFPLFGCVGFFVPFSSSGKPRKTIKTHRARNTTKPIHGNCCRAPEHTSTNYNREITPPSTTQRILAIH